MAEITLRFALKEPAKRLKLVSIEARLWVVAGSYKLADLLKVLSRVDLSIGGNYSSEIT